MALLSLAAKGHAEAMMVIAQFLFPDSISIHQKCRAAKWQSIISFITNHAHVMSLPSLLLHVEDMGDMTAPLQLPPCDAAAPPPGSNGRVAGAPAALHAASPHLQTPRQTRHYVMTSARRR